MASNSQSSPRSTSQLIMTVRPSSCRANSSIVSIDTLSILLMTVKAGMYFLVPRRTSMNSSIVIWSQNHSAVCASSSHLLGSSHRSYVLSSAEAGSMARLAHFGSFARYF